VDGAADFARDQAYWAGAAAVAAWIVGLAGLFVNGVGLFFIWGQLKANRLALVSAARSADAAADAAKSAQLTARPWIKFEVTRAILFLHEPDSGEIGCQIDYRFENIGQTPAVQLAVIHRPVPAVAGHTVTEDDFLALAAEGTSRPRAVFPGESVVEGRSQNFPFPPQPDERMLGFKIIAAVAYRSHSSGELHLTPLTLGLQHKVPPPDRVYRFWRGMGQVECLVIPLGDETPDPT
jgi:hypothetical protein